MGERTQIPLGGSGNVDEPYLSKASLNTLVSCTEPGHLATNLKSKSQIANIFCEV
jgi:hypothetical protein